MNKYKMVLPSGRALLTRLRTIEKRISASLERADAGAGQDHVAQNRAWTEATDRARWEMIRLVEKCVLDTRVKTGALDNG